MKTLNQPSVRMMVQKADGMTDEHKSLGCRQKSDRYLQAYQYARKMHEGQTRMEGTPYIEHPLAVSQILEEKGYPVSFQICGLFHDLLEDTSASRQVIEDLGGRAVLEAVELLSKTEGYRMADYTAKILANPMAKAVKAADRLHNLRSAVNAPEKFRKKYIRETLDWYFDWDPEIPIALYVLADSFGHNQDRKVYRQMIQERQQRTL